MRKNLIILIISDNPLIADDIKATLLRENYIIAGVIRWEDDAMDLIALIKPDLVIADLLLKGDKGMTCLTERINDFSNTPVVFIGGDEIERIRPALGLIQFSGYLLKPFSNRELQNTIDITYWNFIHDRKKGHPKETGTSVGSAGEMSREVTQGSACSENTGLVKLFMEQLSEIDEIFEQYYFGKEVSIVILRQYGDIIYCNENFSKMCGIPSCRITGENIMKFIAPQDKSTFWKILTGWARTEGYGKAEDKKIFVDYSLSGVRHELFRLYSCMERYKDYQGESCLGIISVASEAKDELIKLQEKIRISSYEYKYFEANSSLKGLNLALNEDTPLRQSSAPGSYIRFRRSIFSIIGYAEHIMNGADNLSNEEIKNLAGKINAYLRIIYNLSRDDYMD